MNRYEHSPLKRHASLQPLSRDHYTGLVHAERLRKSGSSEATPGERRAAVAGFLDAWRREIKQHFADEERLLVELMTAAEAAELRDQHATLRELAEQARERRGRVDPDADWCGALGDTLRDHIRWEERELFPAVQQRATPDQLEALAEHTGPIEVQRGRSTAE